tara:strand:+ start:496 stop:1041 length:546 start_codon:yes stop_codon:yes gene_type:complete
MATPYSKQISNRNFLSPIGFKFSLVKEPKVAFFCNAASIPEITLGTSIQTSYLKDVDVPGDKIAYGDLNIRFLVDEDLQNYMAIHNWITGLGFPESTQQYKDAITNDQDLRDENNVFSDGSLRILNSNYNDIAVIKFKDLFPVSLTSLTFDTSLTDVEYLTADVVFKYTIYDILDPQGNPL